MKLYRIYAALFAGLFLFTLTSCNRLVGSGRIISEKRATGNFTGISSSSAIDVELRYGPATEVVVEADDNVIRYVRTEVRGNTLIIGFEHNTSLSKVHVKVLVAAPAINKLDASSAAAIVVKDGLKSDGRIELRASSSGSITAALDAPEISADASSSGDIRINGRTRHYVAEASSSGDIRSFDLLSETTEATANSAGSLDVYASVKLNARASSGGDVRYKGGAAVEKHEDSGGSVSAK